MTSESATHHGQLSQSKPVALENSPAVYGLGTLGLSCAGHAFGAYYLFYYVDVLGLAVTLAAIVNVIYALWDAVNDPLVGYLADNTRTRWGRRRPWLMIGLPLFAVLLVLVYAVPEPFQRGDALFWYALAVIFLFETASTIMNTNYEALFPELFQAFRKRTRASAYNHGLGMIGELAGFSVTPIIYTRFGFVGMAVFVAVFTGILLTISIQRNAEDPRAQDYPRLDLKVALGEVLRDRLFWQFTTVATFLWFTTGIYTVAIPRHRRGLVLGQASPRMGHQAYLVVGHCGDDSVGRCDRSGAQPGGRHPGCRGRWDGPGRGQGLPRDDPGQPGRPE
jgi:GPH family glycoside/pentoside/hexuronide:cation symporter